MIVTSSVAQTRPTDGVWKLFEAPDASITVSLPTYRVRQKDRHRGEIKELDLKMRIFTKSCRIRIRILLGCALAATGPRDRESGRSITKVKVLFLQGEPEAQRRLLAPRRKAFRPLWRVRLG